MAFNDHLPDKNQWLQMAVTAIVTGTIVYGIAGHFGDRRTETAPEAAVSAQTPSGDYQQALATLKSVVQADPENLDAQLMRSALLIKAGDYDAARALLEQLQQSHPDRPEPLNNMAALYAAQGEHKRAIATLKLALDTHPSYAQVYTNLSEIYAAIASDAYSKALGLTERPQGPQLTLLQKQAQPTALTLPAAAAIATGTHTDIPRVEQIAAAEAAPESAAPAVTQPLPEPEQSPAPAPALPVPATSVQPELSAATSPAQPDAAASTDAEQNAALPAPVINTPSTPDMAQVIVRVEAWSDAWQAQDVDGYLSAYASNYTPDEVTSHEDWAQQRRERIMAPAFIELQLKEMQVHPVSDTRVEVRFSQHYRSDRYRDSESKRLVLEREQNSGEWKIIQEG